MKRHDYAVEVVWTGNVGAGTSGYRAYSRNHEIRAASKATIAGSSDPSFRGDATRWNPEDMLLASVATCHKLWYLSLCAGAGVVVTAYEDHATGVMEEQADGAGQFVDILLSPRVTVTAESDAAHAAALHHDAHRMCFVARSVNFPVRCAPTVIHAEAVAQAG